MRRAWDPHEAAAGVEEERESLRGCAEEERDGVAAVGVGEEGYFGQRRVFFWGVFEVGGSGYG